MFAIAGRDAPTRSADLLLRQAELIDEPLERARLLDRVEVRALDVLDERELEPLLFVSSANDRRDRREPGQACGAHPPLARDEREAIAACSTTRTGCRTPCSAMESAKRPQLFRVERMPGLCRVGSHRVEGDSRTWPSDTLGSARSG